jgi:predicted alpha/beta-hydrolase family hydrolase
VARPKSIPLFGEGKTDAVFLAHLCHIYRSPAVITKVEHGKGGSDQTVVQAAIKIARLADYSGVLVLLDSDRDDGPIPADWCKKNRLLIKRASPCLESLLLEILTGVRLNSI